jgi:hypothetical protein
MEGDVPRPRRPTQPNPIVNTYYACMLMMTKSYHSSICSSATLPPFIPLQRYAKADLVVESISVAVYLIRAYDMNPYDPLICLLLAVSYIGRAFQRQADNRNYFVVQVRCSLPRPSFPFAFSARVSANAFLLDVQGLAFLDHYRKLHPQGSESDEVEYNFGSCFHRLGALLPLPSASPLQGSLAEWIHHDVNRSVPSRCRPLQADPDPCRVSTARRHRCSSSCSSLSPTNLDFPR